MRCPHCNMVGTPAHLHILGIRFPALSCAGCDTTSPDYTGVRGWLLDKVFLNFWDPDNYRLVTKVMTDQNEEIVRLRERVRVLTGLVTSASALLRRVERLEVKKELSASDANFIHAHIHDWLYAAAPKEEKA